MPKVKRKRRTTTTNQLSRPKKSPAKAATANVSQKKDSLSFITFALSIRSYKHLFFFFRFISLNYI